MQVNERYCSTKAKEICKEREICKEGELSSPKKRVKGGY